MIRKIVTINENLCDGCGLCIGKCAEGALRLIDGKARLVRDDYCDGLGACLGKCPRDAITVIEREASAFDEHAIHEYRSRHGKSPETVACACPGLAIRSFAQAAPSEDEPDTTVRVSRLAQWPVQLRLVPPSAPYLRDADILVCADCVPFALDAFHERYLDGRVVLVGCPKLDDLAYYEEKLTDIFRAARPRSAIVLRMDVPCCGGIARAVLNARNAALHDLPVNIVRVGISGDERIERDHG